jgi:serine/threonine protein kinase/tetratricopeptide (TPR) repeat protein
MAEEVTLDSGPGRGAVGEAGATPASPPGYELIAEIGRGGMGVVYRACDVALRRDVAVKLLSDRCPADSPAAQRFIGEARITGQLQHPGIPAVHQVGTLAGGRPFLAMKLINGSTLEAILKQRTEPSAEHGRVLAIFEAVCQAVGYAHAHRVIHRDLKPANVMVGAFGEVQVMDWGLAKILREGTPETTDALAEQTAAWEAPAEQTRDGLTGQTPARRETDGTQPGSHTQPGSLVGTPAYIPPEQAIGQIGMVNERSDVFGLGAILAVILTGKPPYVGNTFDSVRVQAVRGKLEDCFARLDGSGAEPELVALCKKCLAFEPADRPTDAGAVAAAVAGLREAADERARRAELERVRVEGEQATAIARSAERRKRRRLAIGAAAVLAVAAVGGLTAVLAVQRRANADLAAKNIELADEQAKVQARFELAQKAIALFHTGVSEDMLLKNEQFKELRTKLLTEAAAFYADLEKLLAGQTDAPSRKALATAYFQLGELTDKIGSKPEALAVHRKALALRRELAATEEADVETRLDVARSLRVEGILLYFTGDKTVALRSWEQQRDIAAALEAESPTDAVRVVLAQSHNAIAALFIGSGKPEKALEAYQQALAIRQKLADAHAAVAEYQSDLALSYNNIGLAFIVTKPEKALTPTRKALAIYQKLADAHPAVTQYQHDLGKSYYSVGILLARTGKLAESLQAHQQALAIRQKLVDANPAVAEFKSDLAWSDLELGRLLARQERFAEAFTAIVAGLAIRQKLAEADPKNMEYVSDLGYSFSYRGWALVRSAQPSRAAADLRQAIELWAKAKSPNPETRFERSRALALLAGLGGEAKAGGTAAERARFADQSVAALREAISAGFNWPNQLQEPDFDSLRNRADFQKLVAEVDAKSGPKSEPR